MRSVGSAVGFGWVEGDKGEDKVGEKEYALDG